jgi:ABC-type oligopeptide transport system substrate-binding subunit
VLYGQVIATVPDAGDLLSVFLIPPSSNNMMWTDPAVVALLNDANTRTGRERLAKLEAGERAAMDDVPTIPMLFLRRQTMQAIEVKGWYADPLARQSLKRLWLETAAPADPREESRL